MRERGGSVTENPWTRATIFLTPSNHHNSGINPPPLWLPISEDGRCEEFNRFAFPISSQNPTYFYRADLWQPGLAGRISRIHCPREVVGAVLKKTDKVQL